MPIPDPLFNDNELFQTAFQYAAIGMAVVGIDGRFLKVNRSLCELVEYSEQELERMTFQDITYPEDLDSDVNGTGKLAAGEIVSHRMEKRYITKTGKIVWVYLQASLVRDAAGAPQFFISQIEDITARKEAERERDALFHLPLFLHAVVGFDGSLKQVNPTWESTFGYTAAEWQSIPLLEIIHPGDHAQALAGIERLKQNKQLVRLNLRFRTKSGDYLHTVWCARSEPEIGVFYASGFDVTPLMEAQEDLSITLAEKDHLLDELRRSSSVITELRSNLLTICAWTKRVRCKGRWVSVDEFLINELGLKLTHGMCAEGEEEFMGGEFRGR